jgi:hypothetical protein
MTSAQVNAWLAVHRGSIDAVSCALDKTLEDAALARMMLHRRRAIVAQVVDEFFGNLESRFAPHLENRAPQAPRSIVDELEISKAASDIAASIRGSAPSPLLFERALLAQMQGRSKEAMADLDDVLKVYPGFVAAAIASARLSLAANNPAKAIRSLVCVETELANTREGMASLADALRAVGMHRSASRYDLATLTCPGYADSHGNDCAPVDMFGGAARDAQMPAAIIIGELADGRLLCNDRGIYYAQRLLSEQYGIAYRRIGRRILQRFRLLLHAGATLLEGPIGRLNLAFVERGWPFPGAGVALDGKDRKATGHDSLDETHGNHRARKSLTAKLRGTLGKLLSAFTAAGLWSLRIANHPKVRVPIYRSYKRLPEPVRYRFNRHVLMHVRRLSRDRWREIAQQDWQSNIGRERLRIGIERILQSNVTLKATGFEPLDMTYANGAAVSDETYDGNAVGLVCLATQKSLEPHGIPPAAAKIFSDLVREIRHQDSEVTLTDRNTEE